MTYSLVFMDLHTSPEDDFKRHEALGNMILEEKPAEIISVGDFASLDSCSQYDTVKRCSMADDIGAIKEAYRLIFGPLEKWNDKRRKGRHKRHEPRTVWCEGNHEEREKRMRKADPDGYASLIDFQSLLAPPAFWQERYDYGQVANVRGVDYTHIPLNRMGKAASMAFMRKHTARHLIWGHTHTMMLETIPQVATENSVRMLLNGPALLRQDEKEHYCEMNTTGWVYGLLRVRPQGPTQPFSFDFVSTAELESQYL